MSRRTPGPPRGPQHGDETLDAGRAPRAAPDRDGTGRHAPSSPLADADARRLIEERLDLNLLVEAGAGSGKTHSLANRMAAGIVSGAYDVAHLAAVTFTRKAAAELRGRFQLALEERLAAATGEARARIERALAGLEHLFAGTIHAFCAHLLRERPVEAGIAPGFTEFDELDDAEHRQRAFRDHLSRLRAEGAPLLHELQRARVGAKDLDDAFATLCRFEEVTFPPGPGGAPDLTEARAATSAFWHQLQALMPSPVPSEATCKTLARAERFRRLLRAAGGGHPADFIEALCVWTTRFDFTMKWWADDRDTQRTVRAEVETLVSAFAVETAGPTLGAWREYLYRLIVTLLSGAREAAREDRQRALTLNFGDLLSAAAALLGGNVEVRTALQRKYRWLLVDEFQDTDPIQAEVMLWLAAEEAAGTAGGGAVPSRDPYDVRLRPGGLFVVGDPKQSIYRFRRADIDTYHRVRGVIRRNGGEVVSLTTSFRARPSLCGLNNRVFAALLPEASSAEQAGFSPLDASPGWRPRRVASPQDGGLRTLTIGGDVPKARVPAVEAEAIARFIRADVGAGRGRWSDYLVLARTKKHLAAYAEALAAWEVPVEVSGAGTFGGTGLAGAFLDLIRVLGDPADAVGVVGVLRGPLFGLSDAQLFAHRQAGGHFGFASGRAGRRAVGSPPGTAELDGVATPHGAAASHGAATSHGAGASHRTAASHEAAAPGAAASHVEAGGPVAGALGQLEHLWQLTRSVPLAAAMERALEETGLLALAAAGATGGTAAGDLLHAIGLVRDVAGRGGTVADTAAILELAAESGEFESVPLEPGQRDVVRVMNLHKAKGLEAPVVFLADPLSSVRRSADVRIVRDAEGARGYLAIRRPVGEHHSEFIAQPTGWQEHAAVELAYLDAEETRLLYVAATRARDLLVVSRWAKPGSGTRPWAALDPWLDEAPELVVPPCEPPAPRTGGAELSEASRAMAAAARERRRELARQPTWAVASVSSEKARRSAAVVDGESTLAGGDATAGGEFGGAPAGAGLAAAVGDGESTAAADSRTGTDDTPAVRAADQRHDAGAAWGTLVHRMLEYAMRRPSAVPSDLERLARWLVLDTPELEPAIPAALDLVGRVSKESFWQEARAGGEVHVEVPFAVRVESGERFGLLPPSDVPTVFHGIVDLAYRSDGGWRILDYKSDVDARDETGLRARHGAQIEAYARAWERATGEPVVASRAISVR